MAKHSIVESSKKPWSYRHITIRLEDGLGSPDLELTPPNVNAMLKNASECGCGGQQCSNCCPHGKPISEIMEALQRAHTEDQFHHAFRIQMRVSPFAGFTGSLCPAPCEGGCTTATRDYGNGSSVNIRKTEYDLYQMGKLYGWFDEYFQDVTKLSPLHKDYVAPSGKTVAIVGSGPAGMQAAYKLRRSGHNVIMFEKNERPGGLLRYGIPDHKLDKSMVDFYFEKMKIMGIEVRTGIAVTASDLSGFDAVVLATGVSSAPRMTLPGMDKVKEGVVSAMDFLSCANEEVHAFKEKKGEFENPLESKGLRTAVIGGGDTGEDVTRTIMRQINNRDEPSKPFGTVVTFDRNPKKGERRPVGNNWPQMKETSDAQELMLEELEYVGGETYYATQPVEVITNSEGKVTHLKVEYLKPKLGHSHLRKKDREMVRDESRGIEGFDTIPVDRVVLALGFTGPEKNPLLQELKVTSASIKNNRTSLPGFYITGDAARPASDWIIVHAQADADLCVSAINHDLGKGKEVTWEELRNIKPQPENNVSMVISSTYKKGFSLCNNPSLEW